MSRTIPPPAVAPVAAALLRRAPELGDRMARRIRAEVTYYGSEERIPFRTLSTSCRRNLELVYGHLADGTRPDLTPALEVGRERARQGTPLAELLHAYRVGSEFLWTELAAEAGRTEGVTADTVISLATWWLIEGYAAAASDAYRETAAALLLQRERERSVLVEALFTGLLTDSTTLWEAADVLGLPADGPFLVVAAEVPAPGRDALPGVESRLQHEQVRSAWRLLPDLQVGVVAVRGPAAEEAALRVLDRPADCRIGVSPSYDSLRDTPKALRLARLALAGLRGRPAGIARFDDHPVAMLVAAAPDDAGRIARVVFDRVLRLPYEERTRLLETLECWFAAGGSAAGAGRLLYCHSNTVRYRLRRLEELVGRSLGDPRTVADLGVALSALRLFPDGPAAEGAAAV
ncbi:PucR family transcriptional regulator [Streptomyces sp. NPDC018031]|uniref:PucR family transcriptional regulator n=1 Tax=Streptomyces sp. NPDC018031 TaxID=3365033 RepID=UPI0037AD21F6